MIFNDALSILFVRVTQLAMFEGTIYILGKLCHIYWSVSERDAVQRCVTRKNQKRKALNTRIGQF